jgi:hypothetical protein
LKRVVALLSVFIIIVALTLIILKVMGLSTRANVSTPAQDTHIIGGFSIDTPARLTRAAADGVQVVFYYGQPPSESSTLGQKLKSLHMKVVDGFIESYLYYYECHRTLLMKPPPGYRPFCSYDYHPELSNENLLLAAVANHLQQVKDNQLIIGYWVLDDWVPWDPGSAQQILVKVHELIQRYTPGRTAICGLGGFIDQGTGYQWSDWLADNFSPQGCDRVGLYMYAPSLLDTVHPPRTDAFNWSMAGLLPAIFSSLAKRGWDIRKEPLIGIAQAFGGPRKGTNLSGITPTAQYIETQSRSFCEHGASGLVFYGWDDSGFGPTAHTPMNSKEIETGIRNGIASCRQIWSQHP